MATVLKIERIKKGIAQWRLANLIGISPQELSNYEVGRRRCPANLRHRIAEVLGISVEELFPEECVGALVKARLRE